MKNTEINWKEHTFNPWWGCVKVSPACDNCYAKAQSKRSGHDIWGKDAERRRMSDKQWDAADERPKHAVSLLNSAVSLLQIPQKTRNTLASARKSHLAGLTGRCTGEKKWARTTKLAS